MAQKNDCLDLRILAQVDGLPEVKAAIRGAISALEQVQKALESVTITMDVE